MCRSIRVGANRSLFELRPGLKLPIEAAHLIWPTGKALAKLPPISPRIFIRQENIQYWESLGAIFGRALLDLPAFEESGKWFIVHTGHKALLLLHKARDRFGTGLSSCLYTSLVTTQSSKSVAQVHHRMPLLLKVLEHEPRAVTIA